MLQQRYFSSGDELRYKLIMVGDPYVGKTALFRRYIEGEFTETGSVTTIDFKIREVSVDNTPIKLYIWDTAGQEKYRAIVSNYFQGCDGVMLLFDLSSENSFRSVTTRWLELARSKSPQAQLMLIGNKSDLMQTVSESEAQGWARQQGAIYLKTSVKLGINVEESYRALTEAIFRAPRIEKAKSFTLRSGKSVPKGKKCC